LRFISIVWEIHDADPKRSRIALESPNELRRRPRIAFDMHPISTIPKSGPDHHRPSHVTDAVLRASITYDAHRTRDHGPCGPRKSSHVSGLSLGTSRTTGRPISSSTSIGSRPIPGRTIFTASRVSRVPDLRYLAEKRLRRPRRAWRPSSGAR